MIFSARTLNECIRLDQVIISEPRRIASPIFSWRELIPNEELTDVVREENCVISDGCPASCGDASQSGLSAAQLSFERTTTRRGFKMREERSENRQASMLSQRCSDTASDMHQLYALLCSEKPNLYVACDTSRDLITAMPPQHTPSQDLSDVMMGGGYNIDQYCKYMATRNPFQPMRTSERVKWSSRSCEMASRGLAAWVNTASRVAT